MKFLYSEYYKTLENKTEEDTERWKYFSHSWIENMVIIKMSVLPKLTYSSNIIPIKIPRTFFTKLEKKTTLKFVWKQKRPQIDKTSLEQKEQSCRHHNTQFQDILQRHSNKTSMVAGCGAAYL
jgi:hypothetical protein